MLTHTADAFKGPLSALYPRLEPHEVQELLRTPDGWSTADFHGQLPLLAGEDVLFVLEGEGPTVAVAGSWNGWSTTADLMQAGPGFRSLQVRLPRDRPQFYKFHCLGNWFRDPHNRLVVWDGHNRNDVGDFNSVIPSNSGDAGGALIWIKRFRSAALHDERDVFVQLPPDYDPETRYPVLYVNDGNESITRAQYHWKADETMRQWRCLPMLLVYVALPTQMVRNFQYVGSDGWPQYAHFMADEVVPFIDRHFNTIPWADRRAILGASLGGACAWYTAFTHPHIFGGAAAQSGSFFVNGMELVRMVREGHPQPLRLYLDSSRPGRRGGGDMARLAGFMDDALRDRNYQFLHHQTVGDRHDWWFWANRLPAAMEYLFPTSG